MCSSEKGMEVLRGRVQPLWLHPQQVLRLGFGSRWDPYISPED